METTEIVFFMGGIVSNTKMAIRNQIPYIQTVQNDKQPTYTYNSFLILDGDDFVICQADSIIVVVTVSAGM